MTVYASAGRRYHRSTDCPAHEAGQLLWDTDEWVPGVPEAKPWRELNVREALLSGLSPCRRCLPGVLVPRSPDFGHRPVIGFTDGRGLGRICARCTAETPMGKWGARWPCATARVLDLNTQEPKP